MSITPAPSRPRRTGGPLRFGRSRRPAAPGDDIARADWLPFSASALVVGALALVLGALLNPSTNDASTAESLNVAVEQGGRWLGMAATFVIASVALMLGMPAMFTLLARRGRFSGGLGIASLSLGILGTTGYAALLVFFRALAADDAIRARTLDEAVQDLGLSVFLLGWVISFYAGIALLALGLLRGHRVPTWVPLLMFAFVAALPLATVAGRVGQMVQLLLLTVALTGAAISAVTPPGRDV
jgi:hypothetical protein